ncbi:MAG TPA: nicotinate phosphoribosyltransferase [Gemmatimonadales bacterium]|nr:nicotinate phosphoribosyltransferase [Gemmatimonadales bacterium]
MTPGRDGAFASPPLTLDNAALFTDLYELTMAAAFFREGMGGTATFSLFVRRLPAARGFLVAAGVAEVLEYLRTFRFGPDAVAALRALRRFEPAFLDYLAGLRFTGSVRAAPEGTVLFADEPLLEITAPLVEAQLVETAVINFCHVQTVLSSKAARLVLAAGGRSLAEFGLRRSHGMDAGLKAARAALLAGFDSTSNVLAARTWGLPLTGTMAHSFVTSFPSELEAFRAYARTFPDDAVLLLDTYDTVAAAHKAVRVAHELAAGGHRLAGVRLDSGDLGALSREVRRILDAGDCSGVRIVVSGGLDEHDIARLTAEGAPIDAFGVGTRLNVSADAPSLDMVYKLVRLDGRDVLKLSEGKATWVGAKQVVRRLGTDGTLAGDTLALDDEPVPAGEAGLLEPVMRDGEMLRPHPSLSRMRAYCAAQLAALPDGLKRLRDPAPYAVTPSETLRARQSAAEAAARVNA